MADDLTPMMRQYYQIKEDHQDKVLFFRLGDFYEMFDNDAIEISKLLNLTLTHRGKTPMCGIPYHSARNYLKRLLDADKKIAICEQVSMPTNPKEIAKREVVQIYTKGTVIEDEYLNSEEDSFVSCLQFAKGHYFIAFADITTGEFYLKNLDKNILSISSFISSKNIKEILVHDDLYYSNPKLKNLIDLTNLNITKLPTASFNVAKGSRYIKEHFELSNLKSFGLEDNDYRLGCVYALLNYLCIMSNNSLKQIKEIKIVEDLDYLALDESCIKNLELVKNLDGSASYTLFKSINHTITSSGSRLLKSFILQPLCNINKITERLNWTQYLINDISEKDRIRKILLNTSDLIRLSSKLEMNKQTPRDLISIKQSILNFFNLINSNDTYLKLTNDLDYSCLVDIATLLDNSINEECTNINNEGTIIKDNFDKELDNLRSLQNASSDILKAYLEDVKAEYDINNLKIGSNKIIGLYIEVSKGQTNRVPDTFIRRQTLVNGERYTNDRLSSLEVEINQAKQKAIDLELQIYRQIVKTVKDKAQALLKIGNLFSILDVYQSYAHVALLYNYTRPNIIEDADFKLVDSRHPVVEQYLESGEFVPNDFDTSIYNFKLITGPNMAGKSTYLRQIALITILAHIGSYVPCKLAQLPLVDKIFTRVGSADNIAKGESTFMNEMQEAAFILNNASRKSLIIMDEIGRGTSTQDGMAIAYGICKYLKELNAVSLFATHYHELTMIDTENAHLLTLDVKQDKKDIIFLKKVITGVAESSYGLHVASLAGVKPSILKSALRFQNKHFNSFIASSEMNDSLFYDSSYSEEDSSNLINDKISSFDINSSSAIEALLFIKELQDEIKAK